MKYSDEFRNSQTLWHKGLCELMAHKRMRNTQSFWSDYFLL